MGKTISKNKTNTGRSLSGRKEAERSAHCYHEHLSGEHGECEMLHVDFDERMRWGFHVRQGGDDGRM